MNMLQILLGYMREMKSVQHLLRVCLMSSLHIMIFSQRKKLMLKLDTVGSVANAAISKIFKFIKIRGKHLLRRQLNVVP